MSKHDREVASQMLILALLLLSIMVGVSMCYSNNPIGIDTVNVNSNMVEKPEVLFHFGYIPDTTQ